MAQPPIIKQLLEAGVHFGHQAHRWNPKMKPYIFGERNGIYIIDLEKTAKMLQQAAAFARDQAATGGTFLFVCTKKQGQEIIAQEAIRGGMYYVNQRWLGGMLTNFQTVRKSVARMKQIQQMKTDGTLTLHTKKEAAKLETELEKLARNLTGVAEMTRLPSALYVIDTKAEEIAVKEANRLGIPVIAIVDTNCDPDRVTHPIPGNDDAIRSIKLITAMIADAIVEGRKLYLTSNPEAATPAEAAAAVAAELAAAEAAAATPAPVAEGAPAVEGLPVPAEVGASGEPASEAALPAAPEEKVEEIAEILEQKIEAVEPGLPAKAVTRKGTRKKGKPEAAP